MIRPIRQGVNAGRETVEGRVNNLLRRDAQGNATSLLLKQAENRQLQAFNGRGLLNSNMAMQAAQEAVISKAIDIASPDARTYFENRRANLNNQYDREDREDSQAHDREVKQEESVFTLRRDYQDAIEAADQNYQRQIDTVNASNMSPADRNIAIEQLTMLRDGQIAFINGMYSKMPNWEREWTTAAVSTGTMDIAQISNRDMLANIANDAGQPADIRQQAADRLVELGPEEEFTLPDTGGEDPNVIVDANGREYPTVVDGKPVNWDSPGPASNGDGTLLQQYQRYYAATPPSEVMEPAAWLQAQGGFSSFGGTRPGGSTGAGGV
jgi:hypothetical protein